MVRQPLSHRHILLTRLVSLSRVLYTPHVTSLTGASPLVIGPSGLPTPRFLLQGEIQLVVFQLLCFTIPLALRPDTSDFITSKHCHLYTGLYISTLQNSAIISPLRA